MPQKKKVILGIFISIIVIIAGLAGVLTLNHFLQENEPPFIDDPPILLFPVANLESLMLLGGYNWSETYDGHNGIDFTINSTANIIASCNMTVNDKNLNYNPEAEFWAASVSFDINDAFELLIGFENFSNDSSAGQQQYDALEVEIGQVVTQGELIGQLLYLSPYTHIHYQLMKNNYPVCPYKYFSTEAKAIFDSLWTQIGYGANPCNNTGFL